MRVLLTGANGRLGIYVQEELLAAGHDLLSVDLRRRGDEAAPVRVVDLLDRSVGYQITEGVDAVVHLGNHPDGGRIDAQRTYVENVSMNAHVFQAAAEQGVRKLIFASSVQAIAGSRRGDAPSVLSYLPMDGDQPACPTNTYGLSKQTGEIMCAYYARNYAMQCIAIRFPWMAVAEEVRRQHPRAERPAPYDQGFHCLHYRDAARLIVATLAADLPGYRCYLPSAPGNRTEYAAAELHRRFFADVPLRDGVDELEDLVDIARITAETGWRPQEAMDPVA